MRVAAGASVNESSLPQQDNERTSQAVDDVKVVDDVKQVRVSRDSADRPSLVEESNTTAVSSQSIISKYFCCYFDPPGRV